MTDTYKKFYKGLNLLWLSIVLGTVITATIMSLYMIKTINTTTTTVKENKKEILENRKNFQVKLDSMNITIDSLKTIIKNEGIKNANDIKDEFKKHEDKIENHIK